MVGVVGRDETVSEDTGALVLSSEFGNNVHLSGR